MGPERLHELNGVRSQIDYYCFILKLLKEEHKQLSSKSLLIPIPKSETEEVKEKTKNSKSNT